MDFFIELKKNLHAYGWSDLFLLGFAALFFVHSIRRRRTALAVAIFVISVVPYFAGSLYWSVYREFFSLYNVLSLKDLVASNLILGLLGGGISLTFFAGIICFFMNFPWAKRHLILGVCVFCGYSAFVYKDPDFNPRELHEKNGFHVTLVGELLLKSSMYFSEPRPAEKEFYLSLGVNQSKLQGELPNIYVGFLESLYISKEIRSRLENLEILDGFVVTIVPTFAGESARSEFEVLCGVPSLKYYGIEFNSMSSSSVPCIANILRNLGYFPVVTNANAPWMFNARSAYRRIGFQKQFWLRDEGVDDDAPGGYIYDGLLFDEVMDRTEAIKITNKKPIFHYFVGAYGHTPFKRDVKKRPPIILNENQAYQRVANQTYYRLREADRFVKTIISRDPSAIIVICSDHLPYISNFEHKNKFIGTCYTRNLGDESIERLFNIPARVITSAGWRVETPINYDEEYKKVAF